MDQILIFELNWTQNTILPKENCFLNFTWPNSGLFESIIDPTRLGPNDWRWHEVKTRCCIRSFLIQLTVLFSDILSTCSVVRATFPPARHTDMVARKFIVSHNDSDFHVDYDTDDGFEVPLSNSLLSLKHPHPPNLSNTFPFPGFQIPALLSHQYSSRWTEGIPQSLPVTITFYEFDDPIFYFWHFWWCEDHRRRWWSGGVGWLRSHHNFGEASFGISQRRGGGEIGEFWCDLQLWYSAIRWGIGSDVTGLLCNFMNFE